MRKLFSQRTMKTARIAVVILSSLCASQLVPTARIVRAADAAVRPTIAADGAVDLKAFRKEVVAWLEANRPPEPDFLLPESFMEVGTEQQFEFLRAWQKKVYEAGYLGRAWPKAYGGGGRPQAERLRIKQVMGRQ